MKTGLLNIAVAAIFNLVMVSCSRSPDSASRHLIDNRVQIVSAYPSESVPLQAGSDATFSAEIRYRLEEVKGTIVLSVENEATEGPSITYASRDIDRGSGTLKLQCGITVPNTSTLRLTAALVPDKAMRTGVADIRRYTVAKALTPETSSTSKGPSRVKGNPSGGVLSDNILTIQKLVDEYCSAVNAKNIGQVEMIVHPDILKGLSADKRACLESVYLASLFMRTMSNEYTLKYTRVKVDEVFTAAQKSDGYWIVPPEVRVDLRYKIGLGSEREEHMYAARKDAQWCLVVPAPNDELVQKFNSWKKGNRVAVPQATNSLSQ